VDEIVALYDDGGRPAGSAPRSIMRAENLRHAATGVVVRDRLGRIYVHRRTNTKDVYPGRWDFTAGGVVLYDEDPLAGARGVVIVVLGM
jgi:isopentenyldiphosphate isomerase